MPSSYFRCVQISGAFFRTRRLIEEHCNQALVSTCLRGQGKWLRPMGQIVSWPPCRRNLFTRSRPIWDADWRNLDSAAPTKDWWRPSPRCVIYHRHCQLLANQTGRKWGLGSLCLQLSWPAPTRGSNETAISVHGTFETCRPSERILGVTSF